MKKSNIKRFSLLFVILSCMFAMTACSKNISADKVADAEKANRLNTDGKVFANWTKDVLTYLDETSDEQLIEDAESGNAFTKNDGINWYGTNAATVEFYNGWMKSREDLGKLKSMDEPNVVLSDETGILCTVTLNATYEKRNCEFEFVFDDENNLKSVAINPVFSKGAVMKKALINTLIGISTVFVVLVFISFIISLFGYINKFETARKNKVTAAVKTNNNEAVDNAIDQIVGNEENEVDDLELVAVIAAAIAAAENTSTDGLVVRSIRRR